MTKEELTDKLVHGGDIWWKEDWTQDELHSLDLPRPAKRKKWKAFSKNFEFNPPMLLHKHDPHFKGFIVIYPAGPQVRTSITIDDFPSMPMLSKVFRSVLARYGLNTSVSISWMDEHIYEIRTSGLDSAVKVLNALFDFAEATYQMRKTSVIPL